MDSHKQQNEEWLEKLRTENDAERKSIAEQKVGGWHQLTSKYPLYPFSPLPLSLSLSLFLSPSPSPSPSLPLSLPLPPLPQSELEKATVELATDKEAFQEKSKKLDAIMKQVQGLTT